MVKDLDQWVRELRQHRDQLAAELGRVDAALAALSGSLPSTTKAAESPHKPHTREASSPMLDLLHEMFAKEPDTRFTAEIALERLQTMGWESDAADPVNAMRTALSRMAKRGEVHRVGRGLYRKNKVAQGQSEQEDPAQDTPAPQSVPDPWAADAAPQGQSDPWSERQSERQEEPNF